MSMTETNHNANGEAASSATLTATSFSLEKYYQAQLENVRRQWPSVREKLQAIRVACVQVHYDGCGDAGQIERIEYFDAAGTAIDPTGPTGLTKSQLMNLFYDLSQARHPGWENDEGALGEFVWDVNRDQLTHGHHERIIEFNCYHHEGL
jgi:hypothetical protein